MPNRLKILDKRINKIIFVKWIESERNWGQRPDGCSLHLTKQDYQEFLREYWKRMPDEVPDEYSRPASNPIQIFVNPKLYRQISETKYGIRLYQDEQRKIETNQEIRYRKIK